MGTVESEQLSYRPALQTLALWVCVGYPCYKRLWKIYRAVALYEKDLSEGLTRLRLHDTSHSSNLFQYCLF